MRQALELRLTPGYPPPRLCRAVSTPNGVTSFRRRARACPQIPVDGRAHVVAATGFARSERSASPPIFVARRRAGRRRAAAGTQPARGLRLPGTLVLRALAIALPPTILLILAIGAIFARRASQRFERVHDAIVRIMDGDLDPRLPLQHDGDDIDNVARAVNLMLDEIARLLDQLKSVGDNIAHDLRTPLAVARAKIERVARQREPGSNSCATRMEAALVQIDKVSMTISAMLRISAVENGAAREAVQGYRPCRGLHRGRSTSTSRSPNRSPIAMAADAAKPVPARGDEDLMREAISNLVDNAIKFTPAGGAVRIEARIRGRAPDRARERHRPRHPVAGAGKHFPPLLSRRAERPDAEGMASVSASLNPSPDLHGFELTVEDNEPGARFVMRGPRPRRCRPGRGAANLSVGWACGPDASAGLIQILFSVFRRCAAGISAYRCRGGPGRAGRRANIGDVALRFFSKVQCSPSSESPSSRPYTFVVMAMLIVIFGVARGNQDADRHLPQYRHSRLSRSSGLTTACPPTICRSA